MTNIALALHGGAGTILKKSITPEQEHSYLEAMQGALDIGYKILEKGKSSLDAVEAVVTFLEDCPLFNAGKGAVFTAAGTHEMDASIMEGKNLQAGAVSAISGIKNPIKLTRLVMEKSGHVFLSGKGAEEFAREMGCNFEDASYFYDEFRYKQWQRLKNTDQFQLDHSSNIDEKFGTVGAVALDQYGNLAAATSTGGMTNKRFGRIGDSPMIGAGNYANNLTCAVSCTGSGEFFIRGVVAYDVSCLMEYKNLSLAAACKEVIQHRLPKIGGDGGLVAVDSQGNTSLSFNTEGMYRGHRNSQGKNQVYIYA
ncbi:isoaspartyl peptidase/L-asparaginase family protein [Fulvivirga sediminis]|uniref:Isoaspartyl peptidase n=1 Tax=Fulvivirga sediminis TaxID=2803949 RepID=A0A937F9M5_9BACT|nr:isoaspartyl peptidase/L-asparaginase [Fulvivirga sediminis]MBL3657164.1 isoaspartyl peptidase/L-asparaginase [Fulvivirga sediminis]